MYTGMNTRIGNTPVFDFTAILFFFLKDLSGKVSFFLYVSGMRQASRNLVNDAFISDIFQVWWDIF